MHQLDALSLLNVINCKISLSLKYSLNTKFQFSYNMPAFRQISTHVETFYLCHCIQIFLTYITTLLKSTYVIVKNLCFCLFFLEYWPHDFLLFFHENLQIYQCAFWHLVKECEGWASFGCSELSDVVRSREGLRFLLLPKEMRIQQSSTLQISAAATLKVSLKHCSEI